MREFFESLTWAQAISPAWRHQEEEETSPWVLRIPGKTMCLDAAVRLEAQANPTEPQDFIQPRDLKAGRMHVNPWNRVLEVSRI